MPNLGTRLEDLLMHKHRSMRYADAKTLVGESRRSLQMSRIEPWNAPLLAECERRWKIQIADTDGVAWMMPTGEETMARTTAECSTNENEQYEKEGTTTRKDPTLPTKPDNDNSMMENTSTTEPEDSDESFMGAKENKQNFVTESGGAVALASNKEEIHDEENLYIPNACDGENEEDEGFSQASDHSQCFTTAIEAGISQAAIDAAIAEAEKEEADDMDFVVKIDATTQKNIKTETRAATAAAASLGPLGKNALGVQRNTKHAATYENKMEDHITIDTAENSELSGIPTIIFVRKDGKCEVPANEPLGESYNIPLALLLANAKKSRMRKLRDSFVRQLQRWGLVRRDTTTRLQENDYEVHVQTLVEL